MTGYSIQVIFILGYPLVVFSFSRMATLFVYFIFDATELEVCLSSSNKVATDKPRKDDLKNNTMIRSCIKVQQGHSANRPSSQLTHLPSS